MTVQQPLMRCCPQASAHCDAGALDMCIITATISFPFGFSALDTLNTLK